MKRFIALLLAVYTVFCLAGCSDARDDLSANNTTATTDPTATTEPTNTPVRHTFDLLIQHNYFDILVRYGKSGSSKETLNIPVYSEDILLFLGGNTFALGWDASAYVNIPNPSEIERYYIFNVLERFPNELRVKAGCSSYAVYDTDTGYRLYLFFVPKNNGGVLTGYPIVINKNKLLSYSDFESIQIGDSIEKVEAIDDVTTLHKKMFKNRNSEYYESRAKSGNPVVSIHYLKDGILRIEYKKLEEQSIVVSNMNFYEDYVIKTADGEMTNHRIMNIDLPVA